MNIQRIRVTEPGVRIELTKEEARGLLDFVEKCEYRPSGRPSEFTYKLRKAVG